MEEVEPCSDAWNRERKSSSKVRGLEMEMEEIEPSSDSWNWEWKSSSQVRGLESEMKEFRRLELGMEKFEHSSKIENGN